MEISEEKRQRRRKWLEDYKAHKRAMDPYWLDKERQVEITVQKRKMTRNPRRDDTDKRGKR